VADLDADGDVEVIYDTLVLEGKTGDRLFNLPITSQWRAPITADLDDDGTLEIIVGESVFSHTGALEWSSTIGGISNFAAVADIDGDTGGETFFVSGSSVSVHDDDGSLIRSFSVPATNPGPPSMADFDGDGEVEIAVSGGAYISVHDVDGTQLWQRAIQDDSGSAGSSGYDINGDGAFEVMYADEDAFRILDGSTGAILYEDYDHASGTIYEYPTIADVDQDGSAEIVVANNECPGSSRGITVYGHNASGWARSGPTWGTHDFAITNLNPDGTVPSAGPLSWMEHNVFRARPTVDNPAFPDLIPGFGDLCVASCANGVVRVAWSVENAGGVDSKAGVQAKLYVVNAGEETLYRVVNLDVIPAGKRIQGGTFEIALPDWGDGIVLRVDEPLTSDFYWGTSRECNEDNNEAQLFEDLCQ